jgi:carbonic anhydrase
MAALMGKVNLDALPSVREWLGHAQATKRRMTRPHGEPTVKEVVEENVVVQADNLKTHPSVSVALRENRVRIFGWVYHFENGAITVYDPRSRKYLLSSELKADMSSDTSLFSL